MTINICSVEVIKASIRLKKYMYVFTQITDLRSYFLHPTGTYELKENYPDWTWTRVNSQYAYVLKHYIHSELEIKWLQLNLIWKCKKRA